MSTTPSTTIELSGFDIEGHLRRPRPLSTLGLGCWASTRRGWGDLRYMSGAVKYANAIAIALVAVTIRWLLVPYLGPDAPYATIMGAVALTVWMGGWGPAVVTAVLGLIGTALVIGRPLGTLPVDPLHTAVGLFLYASTCGLII